MSDGIKKKIETAYEYSSETLLETLTKYQLDFIGSSHSRINIYIFFSLFV